MTWNIQFFVDEAANAERMLRIAKQLAEQFSTPPEVSDFIKAASSIEPISACDLARLGTVLFGFDSDELRTTAMEMANEGSAVKYAPDSRLICTKTN